MQKLPSFLVMSENPFWDFVFMAKKNCVLYSKFLWGTSSSGHIAWAQLAASLAAGGGEKRLWWGCCWPCELVRSQWVPLCGLMDAKIPAPRCEFMWNGPKLWKSHEISQLCKISIRFGFAQRTAWIFLPDLKSYSALELKIKSQSKIRPGLLSSAFKTKMYYTQSALKTKGCLNAII